MTNPENVGRERSSDREGQPLGGRRGEPAGRLAAADAAARTDGGPGGTQGLGAQLSGATGAAKEKAQELAGEAKQQVTEGIQSALHRRKVRAAESLGSVAESLRHSGERLRGEHDGAGQLFERAGGQMERFSAYLQDREVDEIVVDVERLARRQPALFLGGAFAFGLLGARFLKSSRRGSPEQRDPAHPASVGSPGRPDGRSASGESGLERPGGQSGYGITPGGMYPERDVTGGALGATREIGRRHEEE